MGVTPEPGSWKLGQMAVVYFMEETDGPGNWVSQLAWNYGSLGIQCELLAVPLNPFLCDPPKATSLSHTAGASTCEK